MYQMKRAEMPEQVMATQAPEQPSPTSEGISFATSQRLPVWVYCCAKSDEELLGSDLASVHDSIAHMICVSSRKLHINSLVLAVKSAVRCRCA